MRILNYRRAGSVAPLIFVIAAVLAAIAIIFTLNRAPSPQGENTGKENQNGALPPETMSEGASTPPTGDEKAQYVGEVLAGGAAPLLDFVSADYEAVKQTDKLILLYFYANWCPICKNEIKDALYPAFNELATTDIIGFRVNYNDNETDDAERDLAREFGVAYQHTKVFVRSGKAVLKRPDSWTKDRYLSEIRNYNPPVGP